jgi:hypothetical protein
MLCPYQITLKYVQLMRFGGYLRCRVNSCGASLANVSLANESSIKVTSISECQLRSWRCRRDSSQCQKDGGQSRNSSHSDTPFVFEMSGIFSEVKTVSGEAEGEQ